jgi:Uma2 family endonuclease
MVATAKQRPNTKASFAWLEDALMDLKPGEYASATGVPWAVYKRLADFRDEQNSGVRIAFDRGRIELMAPKYRHERPNFRLTMLVISLAEELGIEFANIGSTTLRREQDERGLESDVCFYLQNAQSIAGAKDINLSDHPPPDLAIEVDYTSSSVDKEPIYRAIGVPEIWRHDDEEVVIRLRSDRGEYQTSDTSLAFSKLTSKDLTLILHATNEDGDAFFLKKAREWAKVVLSRS